MSEWAYAREGLGATFNGLRAARGDAGIESLFGPVRAKPSPEDTAYFRRFVSDPAVRGLVTARFLTSYSTSPAIDCWVHTSTAGEDLEYCLRRFQKQGGYVNMTKLKIELKGQKHSSRHLSCSKMFTPELARQVEQGFDSALYRAFGFAGCCNSTLIPGRGARRSPLAVSS